MIFLFATLHEGKLLLVEIVEMSNFMGNDVKSLGIRPREDLLCLFVCFPLKKNVTIFGFLFSLFMGVQS